MSLVVATPTDASYAALLGYPAGRSPEGRAEALALESRLWFERRAHPWASTRQRGIARIGGEHVELDDGTTFRSARLAELLREIEADRLVLAAATAGGEVDLEVERRWRDERPDEAYFLDRFAAAATLEIARSTGERLRREAYAEGLGLAPGYSPGYDGWRLSDQVRLAASLGLPAEVLTVLPSGMIQPKLSILAVFGLGAGVRAADRLWRRHPCGWCSLAGCTLRGGASHPEPRRP